MPRRIKLLGNIAFEEDGRPSRIMNSAKGIALAAYLIYNTGAQNREQVADLLWEASSTRQSLTRLRELLVRVRKWLPEVQATRRTVVFQPSADDFIDLLAFREGLASEEPETLDGALRLYEGDFLAGFYLEDAPYFNEWLVIERERLHLEFLSTYNRLCQTYVRQEAWEKGIDVVRRWLALEPLDETAHRWLIQMLADSGQMTAAFQAYESCRRILQEELGVEPEQATTDLAMQVVAWHETAVSPYDVDTLEPLPVDELPKPGPLPANTLLPFLRNNDFVGRETDLLTIASLLKEGMENGRSPVVAVTGMGGMGKTQTAVEFCYRYGRYFPGGVFWLNFAEGDNVAGEMTAIGSERGLGLFRETENLSQADQVGRVQKVLQEPIPRLLIFDNCEEEMLLADWLPVTGGCRVLMTSRRSGWARSLGVSAVPLRPLPPTESSQLLQRLAPRLSTAESEEIAGEIGRLPLALHLAGGFLERYKQISAAAYLSQLRNIGLLEHPSLRGRGAIHSPTGHKLDIARTLATSLDQLDLADEVDQMARKLLIHAACFASGEPLSQELLCSAVTETDDLMATLLAEDGLSRLTSLGILGLEEATVVLHNLLAAFVLELVADEAALDDARTTVEAAVLEKVHPHLGQAWVKNTLILPISVAHLRYVTEQSLRRGSKAAAGLSLLLGRYFRFVGDYAGARMYLERGLETAETTGDIFTQGRLTSILARNLYSQGYHQQAQQKTLEAERLLRLADMPEKDWLVRSLQRRGWAHLRMGEAKRALAAAEEARELSLKTRDNVLSPNILNLLGSVYYFLLNEYETADTYFEEARALHLKNGDPGGAAVIMMNQAESAMAQGDYQRAEILLLEALSILRESRNRMREISLMVSLSEAQTNLGDYDSAITNLSIVLSQTPKDWTYGGVAKNILAQAYLGLGEVEAALDMIKTSGSLENKDDPYNCGVGWRILGRIAACLERPAAPNPESDKRYTAAECFGRSLKIFTNIDNKRERAVTLWQWAAYELESGNKSLGKLKWQEAKEYFIQHNLPLLVERMEKTL
jgi:DNA-binding SARP family transcriptional activator/Flp pilus assembly protein TadD